MSGQTGDGALKERLWEAGKTAAASASGMAGLAVGSTLVAAAAYAAGAAMATPAMLAGQIGNPMFLGAGAAAIGAGLAVIGAAPAAVIGFVKSMRGTLGEGAMGLKEALVEGWRSAQSIAIHGSLAAGSLGAGIVASNYAAGGGNSALAIGASVASIAGLIVGAAGVLTAAGKAVDHTGAAHGSAFALKSIASRQEREIEARRAVENERLDGAQAAGALSLEGLGSRLASQRQAKAGEGPRPAGASGPSA